MLILFSVALRLKHKLAYKKIIDPVSYAADYLTFNILVAAMEIGRQGVLIAFYE